MFRLLALAALAPFSLAATSLFAKEDVQKTVARQIEPLVKQEVIVGCAVGVLHKGEQHVFGFGEVAKGSGKKPNGQTIYEIGSITKAFTGTLLADMLLRGEVGLDDPAQSLLPEGVKMPQHGDQPITLRHLATHASGLPRLPGNVQMTDLENPYASYTDELLFEFLNQHKLSRPPGKSEYSNLGMGLLGNLLARKAGVPYEQLVIDRICKPLKMSDTRIGLTNGEKQRLAPPYTAELRATKNWDIPTLAGAGALRSNVDDMLKLCSAALEKADSPIGHALQAAFERQSGKTGEINLGLAWHIAKDRQTRFHNGQTGGYHGAVFVHPNAKAAVVVLCNTATMKVTAATEKALQALLGMPVDPIAPRKVVEAPQATLKSYVGVYQLAPGFDLAITLEEGGLMVQATGQSKARLYAASQTKFFLKVVQAEVEFKVEGGKANQLILHQNGNHLPGDRKE